MDPLKLRRVLVLLFLGLVGWPMTSVSAAAGGGGDSASCRFPAVYNFGDSNSDKGGIPAAFDAIQSPNGMTFFGHPSGRACDGHLIIDFMAEKLKVPYLSAYLDSVGTSFRYGANFATGGSSIRPGGYSPFHLAVQVSQFIQFKSRTTYLYNILHSPNSTAIPMESSIARPREFSKALYIFDIAQNDLFHGFHYSFEEQVRASIPDMINTFSEAVQQLYKEGARYFWVHNTGPIGCLPYSILYNKSPDNRDSNGCVESQNEVSREFNRQLKSRLLKLGKKLPLARIIHIDMYSAKYLLISKAKTQGFVKNPVKFCCGSYYGYHIDCGKREVVNGTVYGNPCKDPSRHISWDGIHYSEAANLWIANHILNGSFSDPPLPIDKACQAPRYA
ncbi:GDSL esterase/lipase At3g27950-like isoform X1 [Cucurbita maxima]|uniref:GDSL esterase/lipase At3g27950-like isoform X1 n=1 Tax=Cucurbita maxima TaxID=3661 RepID=A0A6J1K0N4_CUCMA|nr:GDSL esterase/lipase At3g27950-like isoform X1 [Cucurbita maxima]XP_022993625.1 GDSL esterase/lipase At3g27950-like isoform X1 [Cucurbita maxima]